MVESRRSVGVDAEVLCPIGGIHVCENVQRVSDTTCSSGADSFSDECEAYGVSVGPCFDDDCLP